MQRSLSIRFTALILLLFCGSFCHAQQEGQEDLDAAFDKKVEAKTLGDFEEVVDLCKSALKKGLDTEGEVEARNLASSALYEHVEQLMLRLRNAPNPNFYRREALKKLDETVEFNDEMGEAWLMIARLNMIRGGDKEKARSAVDRAVGLLDELPKKQAEAHRLRAILLSTEDREAGLEDLNRAVELDNTNLLALQTRASVLLADGEIDKGLADTSRMAELNDGKVEALLSIGTMLSTMASSKASTAEANGDGTDEDESPGKSTEELEADANKIRESAIGIFEKVIELAPENTAAYILKAATHQELEEDEAAIATIDALIERDDKSIEALLTKVRLLIDDEANDEKINEILDKAINLDPYNERTRKLRMAFFADRNRMSDAIEEAEKIIEKNPSDADTLNRLGLFYTINEQPEKAIEIQSSLLTRMPTSWLQNLPPRRRPFVMEQKIDLLRSRGDSYLSTGEHEKAIEDYEEALALSYQIEEMQASLGDIGIEFTPNDGVLNNLAWVLATSTYDELRDGERAIELATRACEVTDFKAPHILSTLASGYAETGDFEKAIEWIGKGLELNEERELDQFGQPVTEEEKARQKESLEKELDAYKAKKPWRENQAEEDAAKKEAAKKADQGDAEGSDESEEEEDK